MPLLSILLFCYSFLLAANPRPASQLVGLSGQIEIKDSFGVKGLVSGAFLPHPIFPGSRVSMLSGSAVLRNGLSTITLSEGDSVSVALTRDGQPQIQVFSGFVTVSTSKGDRILAPGGAIAFASPRDISPPRVATSRAPSIVEPDETLRSAVGSRTATQENALQNMWVPFVAVSFLLVVMAFRLFSRRHFFHR